MTISVPGKIIISGEHSAVFGHPALVATINRRLTIDESFRIKSAIPIGAGMGSSAAYSVAVTAMKLRLKGQTKLETVNKKAYQMEKYFHDNPSGIDNTACTYGGWLWFQKNAKGHKRFLKITPKRRFPQIFLHNTGRPKESTRNMVQMVKGRWQKNPQKIADIMDQIALISRDFLDYIRQKNTLSLTGLIRSNQELLEKLGVVSLSTQKLIRSIEKIGGAAKISGAGGKEKNSGVLIIYHPAPKKLKQLFTENRLSLTTIKLGVPGLTYA